MIWNLAYLSGLLTLLQKEKFKITHKGLIFYYHRVHPGPGWDPVGVNISPSLFYRQIALIKKKFPVLPLSVFFDQIKKSPSPASPVPSVVITFDDGYQDVWDYAWPVLKNLQIAPTFFVCTDPLIRRLPLLWDLLTLAVQVDQGKQIAVKADGLSNHIYSLRTGKGKKHFVQEMNRHLLAKTGEEQREAFVKLFETIAEKVILQAADLYLGADQIKECLKAGIEIGAHTASHPYLPLLPAEEWDHEIRGPKVELERLIGAEVPFFSYPAGRWNAEVRDYVIQSGYQGALATGKRVVSSAHQDFFCLPRISPEGVISLGKFFALVSGVKREWFD